MILQYNTRCKSFRFSCFTQKESNKVCDRFSFCSYPNESQPIKPQAKIPARPLQQVFSSTTEKIDRGVKRLKQPILRDSKFLGHCLHEVRTVYENHARIPIRIIASKGISLLSAAAVVYNGNYMKNSSDAIIIRGDSAVFNQRYISIRWLRYFNYRVFTVGLGSVPFGIFLLFFSLFPFIFFLFSAFVSPPGHRYNPPSISRRSPCLYPCRQKTFRGA